MAFTPTKYFTTATTIVGADIQENLDGLKDYVSGGMRALDLEPTSWATPRHIMRGRYDPIVNAHSFTSGINAGRNSKPNEMSWANRATTGSAAGTEASLTNLPNTSITFRLEADAHVIIQFYASPVNPYIADVPTLQAAHVYLYLDEVDQIAMSKNVIRSEGLDYVCNERNNFAGSHMATLSKGDHSLSLKAWQTSTFMFLCNWGISLEVYYK
tara:strand:+ start:6230 stop:6868 length:639 start_codon:yes stop_codon:yes gene_type:complete